MFACVLLVKSRGNSGIVVKFFFFFKMNLIGYEPLLLLCDCCTWKAHAASDSEKINIDFVCEIVNFGTPNLIILKKNENTTKYHNIFTISSFLGSE